MARKMKQIIEQDICATCTHLEPSKPLPTGRFEIICMCAKEWTYTEVNATANAISECPDFAQ